MDSSRVKNIVLSSFHGVCIVLTVLIVSYNILLYLEDEDLTEVSYKMYNQDDESIYPGITICLRSPFQNKKLEAYGSGINRTTYEEFLRGHLWDERMLAIDYDNVTVSFANNLLLSNYITNSREQRNWNLIHYISFRSSKAKCFTIDAPYIDKELLTYFRMDINNYIFPNGGRSKDNRIFIYIHYPEKYLARKVFL